MTNTFETCVRTQGRNPLSCLAGAIALTIHIFREKYADRTTTDVAVLLGIADNTVRKAHRDVLERVHLVLTPQCIRRYRLPSSIVSTLAQTSITLSPTVEEESSSSKTCPDQLCLR